MTPKEQQDRLKAHHLGITYEAFIKRMAKLQRQSEILRKVRFMHGRQR